MTSDTIGPRRLLVCARSAEPGGHPGPGVARRRGRILRIRTQGVESEHAPASPRPRSADPAIGRPVPRGP